MFWLVDVVLWLADVVLWLVNVVLWLVDVELCDERELLGLDIEGLGLLLLFSSSRPRN